jgi:hypothetical protein
MVGGGIAARYAGFLDSLGLDRVHYPGESIGGTLGIAFCGALARAPEEPDASRNSNPYSATRTKALALGYDDWPAALGKLGSGGWAKALMESGGGLTGGDSVRAQWVIDE